MISLSIVILTFAIVFTGLWMLIRFNKDEELKKDYRDKYTNRHHKKGA
ncbi:MAG: hypothetical protein ACM3MG_09685 [Bacillota bacterium]